MVTGPVRQAHEVRVALDKAWKHRAALQVDHAAPGPRVGGAPDRNETAIPDGDGADHCALVVHRVDAAVDECQFGLVVLSAAAGGLRRAGQHRAQACGRKALE